MGFTIKELATLSGIKAHTIRIWEQRYHFIKPSRTSTNIRIYSNEELKTLLNVALLNKHGFKISQIDDMGPAERLATILNLKQPRAKEENLINELVGCMVDLQYSIFEKLLNHFIQQHSLPKAIDVLIFPFMEKIGILWQTGNIHPVQEHIVSNIIRQKIISSLDKLPIAQKPAPLFILFLPEDEHHELGLLYVFYHLRKQSLPVIYLGANVPFTDISYIVEVKQPAYLYLHLTSLPRHLQLAKYLQQLSVQCKYTKILVSGSSINNYQKPLPPNATFFFSFSQVDTFLTSLNGNRVS